MPVEQQQPVSIADLKASGSLRDVRPYLTDAENTQLNADLEVGDFWQVFQTYRSLADKRSNPTNRAIVEEVVARTPGPTLSADEMAARLGVTLRAA